MAGAVSLARWGAAVSGTMTGSLAVLTSPLEAAEPLSCPWLLALSSCHGIGDGAGAGAGAGGRRAEAGRGRGGGGDGAGGGGGERTGTGMESEGEDGAGAESEGGSGDGNEDNPSPSVQQRSHDMPPVTSSPLLITLLR